MYKHIIRNHLLKHRQAIPKNAQEQAAKKIRTIFSDYFGKLITNHSIVGGFIPINSELSDLFILEDLRNKNIQTVIPHCIDNNVMEFYKWDGNIESLVKDSCNMLSVSKTNEVIIPTHLLVPLLGINKQGYRLGYGKGYYDKYLAKHPKIVTIGVCFASQIIDDLPIEQHDVSLNYILSENGLLALNGKSYLEN